MSDVSVVVVTYNGLPWIEQCLDSVRGNETVLVDNGSSDGTVAFVRGRFPEVTVVEQENRGLAAGWNVGIEHTSGRYVLLLNSDAWLHDGALDAMVAFADAHPEAAVVGPRLRNPDGSLQRSVRGFPTLWRLATEYFFLRKLAPRSRALNAFYAGGFDHDTVYDAEFLMGAVWLVRRAAIALVGPADDRFFLFSEEVDWAYRFRQAGWRSLFFPGRGGDARVRRVARGQAVRGDPEGASALPREAPRHGVRGARAAAAARRARAARPRLPRRARPDVPGGGDVAPLRFGGEAARMTARELYRTRRRSAPFLLLADPAARDRVALPGARLRPVAAPGRGDAAAAPPGPARRARLRPARLAGGGDVVGRARGGARWRSRSPCTGR